MSTSNLLDHFDESEEEDDNFNPAPADISDDENENDDDAPEDQAQNEVAKRTMTTEKEDYEGDEEEDAPGNARAEPDAGDDEEDDEGEGIDTAGGAADDDEEDEEEDDDDEEEVQGHRRKRHRKDRRNQFLDVEAEVDEDEDEVDEDEDELNELKDNFIADTHPDDLADLPAGGDMDDRGHREVDRMREREMHMDAEKQAEMLKRKYAKSRSAHGAADSAVIPKRLLLPSVHDPSIWAVRCREGKEREAIFAIMKRIEERMGTRDELAITAAFERGGPNAPMKGHVYVESRSQADILKALDGIMNVYPRNKMHLVEIKEMPDLLRVSKTESLEAGTYVRMKKPPLYAGDLAQIMDVTENGLEVRLRLVPRLDYGLNEDLNASGEKRKRPGASIRPPPRLFSEVEAKKRHIRYLTGNPQTKTFVYKGEDYVHGYLEKDMKIQNLTTKDVNPTLEEVTRFASGGEDGTENLDLNALAASLKASTASATYLPGDVIEVYEGEQKGLSGKAVTVHGDIVTLAVTEGPLKGQSIEVPVKGLRKKFREGDHVKVIGGSRYRDEVGMVVAIVDDRITLLSDQNHSEIIVFSKDLREASDSGGAGSLGQYTLFDLVQLDPATVACIVKIDRESMIVLDQNSQVRTVMPTQISNKIDKRRHAAATDRNGNEIRIDDSVKEYGGESKTGKILHIHRSFLFLHSLEQNENAGIFVARSTGVTSMSAKGARGPAGPDLSSMNPALQRHGAGAAALMPPPRIPLHRDRSIGQTVTIRKGVYKGLLGIVKDATDTHVRVELHTKAKVVAVPREQVAFKDKYTGAAIDPNSRGGRGGAGRGSGRGGATPAWDGGRTPAPGGAERTPAWGSRTPGHPMANGGRTPAWQQGAGGRTPAWQDGSRTAIPGDRTAYGGRTPAWAAGSKTPAYDGFGAGSKTPAYGGGGGDTWGAKTPAHPSASNESYSYASNVGGSNGSAANGWASNVANNAPTPGANTGSAAYDAPTPAAGGHTAPTPAAMNAPTPGAYSAPTPAASAPTPAANGWGDYGAPAPTPGASGLAAPTPGASWGGGGYVGAPTPVGYGQAETPGAWGGGDGDINYAED